MESGTALPEGEPTASARKIILVVEDEFLVRMLLCDELRAAGYQIVEAATADEAIAILKSGTAIDLMLSDVRMPGSVDGLGLLALVRRSWPAIPVIITSGHLQPEAAFADGATQFLPKPYFASQAIELIESELAKVR